MVGAIEARARAMIAFWKRQKPEPEPERVQVSGLVTPSGDIIPLVQTPRGEEFRYDCKEAGIYRTIHGKIFPCAPGEEGHVYIALSNWRPMKPDEPHYGEAVDLLRKAAWQ
jgi:hypothetical protein